MTCWYDDINAAKLAMIAAILILIGDALLFASAYTAVKKLDFLRVKD
jgi:hypothetical protein